MSEFFLEIENNNIVQQRVWDKYVQEMKSVDGSYKIIIEKGKRRSLQSNRYLHGLLIPEFRKALNSVGYNEVRNDEQAKLIMKSMFLTREVKNEEGGKPVHFVQDTHTLTGQEISVLIEEVIRFAAENMNYQIPYPGERLSFDF